MTEKRAGSYFIVYSLANFETSSCQITLAKRFSQSYNPTNLNHKTLPVLVGEMLRPWDGKRF